MTPGQSVFLAEAGLVAGAVNAISGGGSLLSFPALLAVGLPPLPANVTNTVGLLPGYLGGTIGYRRELAGQGARARALTVTALLGAGAGCALLLLTPAEVFATVVPFLVLGAVVLLAVQPRVAAWLRRDDEGEARSRPVGMHVGAFLSAIYGAYFGAALGVLLLGVLGIVLHEAHPAAQRPQGLPVLRHQPARHGRLRAVRAGVVAGRRGAGRFKPRRRPPGSIARPAPQRPDAARRRSCGRRGRGRATHPGSWPPCATPPSACCASTAGPTSPKPSATTHETQNEPSHAC